MAPPPAANFVSDLSLAEHLLSTERCLVAAPAASAGGGSPAALIATMVDMGASHPAMITCRPDWITTQDLSVHGAGPLEQGPVVVDCRLVRAGKKVVVTAFEAYDSHGLDDLRALATAIDTTAAVADRRLTQLASGLITFARIPGSAAPGMEGYDPTAWLGQVRATTPVGTPAGTAATRLGATVLDAAAGRLELARTPYLTNSIGTILGAAQATLLQLAAEGMRPGMQAADLEVHFLAQVRVGPVRTAGVVLRTGADHSVVDLRLVDAGDGDRLLSLATVTLTPAPGSG